VVFIAERNRRTLDDPEAEEHVSSSWRRFYQAIDDMNDAEESEDYQAVGVKCGDALITLAKEHAAAEWVGDIHNHLRPPTSKAEPTSSLIGSARPAGFGRTSKRSSTRRGI
jgi:hypothetical protein